MLLASMCPGNSTVMHSTREAWQNRAAHVSYAGARAAKKLPGQMLDNSTSRQGPSYDRKTRSKSMPVDITMGASVYPEAVPTVLPRLKQLAPRRGFQMYSSTAAASSN